MYAGMYIFRLDVSIASVNSIIYLPVHDIKLIAKAKVHHWKENDILVQKQHYNFATIPYLYAISAFEEHGNAYKPGMHICVRHEICTHRDYSF